MKLLVVYASHDGQTEKIARFLADHLRAMHHEVRLMDAGHPVPAVAVNDFQAMVIGAPVRMMKYPLSIVNFVRANRARLTQVPTAFFSVCMAVASDSEAKRREAGQWPEKLFSQTGWRPTRVTTFAGALRYTRYNILVRWMMKRIAKSEGASTDTSRDHEYTDWAAVGRFAAEFVQEANSGVSRSSPTSK